MWTIDLVRSAYPSALSMGLSAVAGNVSRKSWHLTKETSTMTVMDETVACFLHPTRYAKQNKRPPHRQPR